MSISSVFKMLEKILNKFPKIGRNIVLSAVALYAIFGSGCSRDSSNHFNIVPVLAHKWDGNAGFNIIKIDINGDEINLSDADEINTRIGFRDFDPALSQDGNKLCFTRFNGPYGTFGPSEGNYEIILADSNGENQQIISDETHNFYNCSFNSDGTKMIIYVYDFSSHLDLTAIINTNTNEIEFLPTIEGYRPTSAIFGIGNEILEDTTIEFPVWKRGIVVRDLNNPSLIKSIINDTEDVTGFNSFFLNNYKVGYGTFDGRLALVNYDGTEKEILPDNGFFNSDPKVDDNGNIYHGCRDGGNRASLCVTNSSGETARFTEELEYGSPFPLD